MAYIYREKPKKPGDKSWTRVYHKIYIKAEGNEGKLMDDITWLKGKGIIKELDDTSVSNNTEMSTGGLANLWNS